MTQSPRLSQISIHQFFASLPDPRRRPTRIKHPPLVTERPKLGHRERPSN